MTARRRLRQHAWVVALALIVVVALAAARTASSPSSTAGHGATAIPPGSAAVQVASDESPPGVAVLSIGPQAPAVVAGRRSTPIQEASSGQPLPWPVAGAGLTPPAGFFLRVPILMYHRIVPPALAGDALPSLVVPPQLFAAQLAALKAAGWHSVTVAAIAAALEHHRPLPPRTFAISIDDGWADGFNYALPILLRYGDVATFYVIAGRLDDSDFLSPADLRVLSAHGMEIGDHTLDHLDLTRLSPAALQAQIMGAEVELAAACGERPATLAYPFGRFDPAVEVALQHDGFALAVTTQPGWYEDRADQFAVPRVRVGPNLGPSTLVAELSGALPLG